MYPDKTLDFAYSDIILKRNNTNTIYDKFSQLILEIKNHSSKLKEKIKDIIEEVND